MTVCNCMGGPNCCRNRRDPAPGYFSMERMKRALAGPSFMVPLGMTREERIAYITEVAEHIETGGVEILL